MRLPDSTLATPLATPRCAIVTGDDVCWGFFFLGLAPIKNDAAPKSFPSSSPCRSPFGGTARLQPEALEIVLHFLGDDDVKVREAAGAALVRLVPRLVWPADSPGA